MRCAWHVTHMPTIAVDAMGGDFAPDESRQGRRAGVAGDRHPVPAGRRRAADPGDPRRRRPTTPSTSAFTTRREFIGMAEDPKTAVRAQARRLDPGRRRSWWPTATPMPWSPPATPAPRCWRARSTSSSIHGVRKAALASVYPRQTEYPGQDQLALLLDVGATIRCDATELVQFALMGSAYARARLQGRRARASRCSTWAPRRTRAARCWCRRTASSRTLSGINFVGNIEGNDLAKGKADVIVCEGLLGNVVLKLLEGLAEVVVDLAGTAARRELALEARHDDAGERLRQAARSDRLRRVRRRADPRLRAPAHQVARPLERPRRSRTRSRSPPRRCATASRARSPRPSNSCDGPAPLQTRTPRRRPGRDLPLGPRQDLPQERVRDAARAGAHPVREAGGQGRRAGRRAADPRPARRRAAARAATSASTSSPPARRRSPRPSRRSWRSTASSTTASSSRTSCSTWCAASSATCASRSATSSPSCCKSRADDAGRAREVLFGDDWESDPIIYSLYADVVAGRVAPDELDDILRTIGVDPQLIAEAKQLAAAIAHATMRVADLHQPRTPHAAGAASARFGPRLVPTFNYFQTAACLFQDGHLTLPAVAQVADALIERIRLHTGAAGQLAGRHRAARASPAGRAPSPCASTWRARGLLPQRVRRAMRAASLWRAAAALADAPTPAPCAGQRPQTINYQTLVAEWRAVAAEAHGSHDRLHRRLGHRRSRATKASASPTRWSASNSPPASTSSARSARSTAGRTRSSATTSWLLIIKTRAALFDALAARVGRCTRIETPEVIALPITRRLAAVSGVAAGCDARARRRDARRRSHAPRSAAWG